MSKSTEEPVVSAATLIVVAGVKRYQTVLPIAPQVGGGSPASTVASTFGPDVVSGSPLTVVAPAKASLAGPVLTRVSLKLRLPLEIVPALLKPPTWK